MSVWVWAIILFVVGVVEFVIDQYQAIIAVRLKTQQTILFTLLNQYFDFAVHVFLFGMIIDFWTKFHNGIYDFHTLIPYIFYVHGTVAGTALALIIYKHRKKSRDRKHRIGLLEKARVANKRQRVVKSDIKLQVQETMLDEIEREDLKEQIKEQAIDHITKVVEQKLDQAFGEIHDGQSEEAVHDHDHSGGSSTPEKGSDEGSAPGTR